MLKLRYFFREGAIELSILAEYYGREIAAYDIQTTRCDLYGQVSISNLLLSSFYLCILLFKWHDLIFFSPFLFFLRVLFNRERIIKKEWCLFMTGSIMMPWLYVLFFFSSLLSFNISTCTHTRTHIFLHVLCLYSPYAATDLTSRVNRCLLRMELQKSLTRQYLLYRRTGLLGQLRGLCSILWRTSKGYNTPSVPN